jgi:YbbR domain-containing protein
LIITEHPPKGIEARVRALKALAKTLPEMELRYKMDVSDLLIGIHAIPVNPENVKLPQGISILKINPSFLTMKMEKEVKKAVPVVISISGDPAPGFEVVATKAEPSFIILRGSEKIVSQQKEIPTKPIDVNGISESFQKKIALDLLEGTAAPFISKPIHVEVQIKERIVSRKFRDIPVAGKGSPYPHKITPPVINIVVKGPENVLKKLQKDKEIKVQIDLNALKPGIYPRRAIITLPVTTTLVNVKPKIFTVTIKDG